MPASCDLGERLWANSKVVVGVRQVRALTDDCDREITHSPALADSRIKHRRLATRV